MLFGNYDILICDLDGTLCDIASREHLAQQGMWDEFHANLSNDPPRLAVLSFLQALSGEHPDHVAAPQIHFLTGRPEEHRAATVEWLEDQGLSEGEEYASLIMRPKEDWRSDHLLKAELLEDLLKPMYPEGGLEEAKLRTLILDDRDKVVAHFRDLGYECWQVRQGNY